MLDIENCEVHVVDSSEEESRMTVTVTIPIKEMTLEKMEALRAEFANKTPESSAQG